MQTWKILGGFAALGALFGAISVGIVEYRQRKTLVKFKMDLKALEIQITNRLVSLVGTKDFALPQIRYLFDWIRERNFLEFDTILIRGEEEVVIAPVWSLLRWITIRENPLCAREAMDFEQKYTDPKNLYDTFWHYCNKTSWNWIQKELDSVVKKNHSEIYTLMKEYRRIVQQGRSQ